MKGPLYYATYPDAGRSEATYGASGTDGTREMISWALPEGPVLLHQLPSPLLRLLADGNKTTITVIIQIIIIIILIVVVIIMIILVP